MSSRKIEDAIESIFQKEQEIELEKVFLWMDRVPRALGVELTEESLSRIKKKLFVYKGRKYLIKRFQLRRILEEIVYAYKQNKEVDDTLIDSTIRRNEELNNLETSNTIIIGDKENDTQIFEFKSIVEPEISVALRQLEEQTKNTLNIPVSVDTFITKSKTERAKRIEELREIKELPKLHIDQRYPHLLENEKFDRVIGNIDQIIRKDPKGERNSTVKELRNYEGKFNERMVSLLHELSDKISNTSPLPVHSTSLAEPVNTPPKTPTDSSTDHYNALYVLSLMGTGAVIGIIGMLFLTATQPY
ncbi:hypothetical protein NEFER03_0704 [Nematocida sp. LUAm3]|nr:hypothetical protein NEFER03_0704 [Nematocida sp. LUAm3]KAI5175163.1 hypothetical protein NEFER02_1124 [Nematocida sp. LUAm2]KAI5178165.1 hypothetical protein NEFER01_1343 [Nematocida sp. LUAm1]